MWNFKAAWDAGSGWKTENSFGVALLSIHVHTQLGTICTIHSSIFQSDDDAFIACCMHIAYTSCE